MHLGLALLFIIWNLRFMKSESENFKTTLRTCCRLQNQFSNGSCKTGNASGNLNEKFNEFITIDGHLLLSKLGNSSMKFSLKHQPNSCPNGTFTITISLNSSENVQVTVDGIVKNKSYVQFLPDGGFLKSGDDNFYPDNYCFNRIDSKVLEIIVCNSICSEDQPCLPKCCNIDEVWDLSRYPDGPLKCSSAGQKRWEPKIYSSLKSKHSESYDNDRIKPHLITSHPKFRCTASPVLHALKPVSKKKKELFKILSDGSVMLKINRKQWTQLTPGTFCIDGAKHFPGETNNLTTTNYSGDFSDTIIVDCSSEDKSTCLSREPSDLYGITLMVASVFLLVTVIVYILLWEKQNIHGWTSLSYFASLFFMYIFTSLVHFSSAIFVKSEGVDDMPRLECYAIAICTHFFWISSFCWMSAVNFDLWWTFRALMPTGSKSKGIKRYLTYVIFSLGIPLVIVGTGITLDQIYDKDLDSDIIVPEYARKTCYMDEQFAPLPYVYGPIGILLISNLVFFTFTVYDMYKIQQSTKFASMSSSKNQKQKQSLKLFAKLFLLMGIPWTFEVISWAISPCGQVAWYWVIFDMINIFQAVAIFLTFVCKTETRNALELKFPKFKSIMMRLSIRPDRARAILERRPGLKFIIKPFTRSWKHPRGFSSRQTLSTVAESRFSTKIDRNIVVK